MKCFSRDLQKMMKMFVAVVIMITALFQPFVPTFVHHASAAALTSLSDTMSTVKKNTVSNHDISFVTPTGVASGQTIILTFPSDYSINASLDYTDIDVLDDGVNVTLAGSPSGATWGAVRTSGTVITLTNGNVAVGAASVVRIKIGTNATNQSTGVRQITNPTTAGSYAIALSGTFTDTGSITTTIVDDDTVAVSATVGQSLTFTISSNSITFGTLSASAARYADGSTGSASDTVAHTLAVATNGTSGYTITVKGATLTSGLNSIDAIGGTPAASSTGTEQFGIYATKAGGSNGTIATPYATASSFGYDASASTATTFASGTSATATETYSLHYLANIAATTEAGSYTANLVYVATANF